MSKITTVVAWAALILTVVVGGLVVTSTGELGGLNQRRQNIRGIRIDAPGNLWVGNGTPDVTVNGEDMYVEGTSEFDGAARFDGTVQFVGAVTGGAVTNDLDGGPFYLDPNQSSILRAQTNGLATLTLPATGTVQVTTGSLRVGNGSNGTTLNGEDLYVEGTSEFDGVSNFAAQMTVLDDILVGAGTPTITQNGGDIYATDQLEVDGEAQFDGAMDVNGAVDLDGVVTNAANLEHILFPTVATASFTYTAAAGATIPLFTVGANEIWLVHDIRVNVTSNFNATGDDATVNIGDSNDVDGFCVLADAELQTADTEGTGWEAGWQCQVAATRGVFIDGTGGYIYSDSETIDAIVGEASGTTLAGGAATVYLTYTRIQ